MRQLVLIVCNASLLVGTLDAQTAHFSGAQSAVNFGFVNIGSTSPPVTIPFSFDTAGALGSTAVLTQGATGLDFADAGAGSCVTGNAYSAGDSCTIDVTFAPEFAGTRNGAAVLKDSSGSVIATGYVYGTGSGPQVSFLPPTTTMIFSGFTSTAGVAVDGNGNVYIADWGAGLVWKETRSGGSYSPSQIGSGLDGPAGIAVDGAGNVYIADSNHNRVLKESPSSSGYSETAIDSGLIGPQAVAVDGSGNVYVVDSGNQRIVKETLAGGSYTASAIVTGLTGPAGIAVDAAGNLSVADGGGSQVYIETLSGGTYTQSVISNSIAAPYGIAVDGNGNVFIVDKVNSLVVMATPAGGSYTQSIVSTGFSGPLEIAVDGSGNLYVTEGRRVFKEDLQSAPRLTLPHTASGSVSTAADITLLNRGNADLNIGSIDTSANYNLQGPDTTCAATFQILNPGASCILSVEFSPTSVGFFSGTITLTDNHLNASSPQAIQTISLEGAGTALSQPQSISAIVFSPAALLIGGQTTASATATSGLAVLLSSLTPAICGVDGALVTGLAPGLCSVAADRAGDSIWLPAPQATAALTIPYLPPSIADATGYSGQAFSLAGSSYGLVYNGPSPQFSFCAWFNWADYGTANVQFLTGKNKAHYELQTGGTSANGLRFIPAGWPASSVDAPNIIQPGWNHVAATWDGSSAMIYVNGTLAASRTGITGADDLTQDASPLHFGNRGDGSFPYSGLLDDVAFFDRAITAEEATALYNAGAASHSLAAPPITATSATVFGEVNDNGVDTQVTVEFGISTSYGSTESASPGTVTANSGATQVSSTLSGLTPWTKYYYRFDAQSAAGTTYGAGQSFTTLVGSQSISALTFTPATLTVGGTATASAAASSGLAVIFSSQSPLVCSVTGATVSPLGLGTCIVVANQSGNAGYTAATEVTESIVIDAAAPVLTLACTEATYDGNAHFCVGSALGIGGAAVSGVWSLSPASVTSASSTAVTGTFTSTDPNYLSGGTATGTLLLDKATATVVLGNLNQIFTGLPSAATATTNPPGLTVSFAYNGSAAAPTAAGTYAVVGTVGDVNLSGTTTGTLTVGLAPQSITFPQPGSPVQYGTSTIPISATGGASGNPVVFSIVSGPGSIAGETLAIANAGTITVAANQAGNNNYQAASPVTRNIVVVAVSQVAMTGLPAALTAGGNAGHSVTVLEKDSSGKMVASAKDIVTVAVTGPSGYFKNYRAAAVEGVATFNLSSDALTAAGSYLYTATVAPSPAIKPPSIAPSIISVTVNAAATAKLAATTGSGQSTVVGTAFASPLQVVVTDAYDNPVSNVIVTFTAPEAGPSAKLTAGGSITSGSSGTASVVGTANGSASGYKVVAASGALAATFSLTNIDFLVSVQSGLGDNSRTVLPGGTVSYSVQVAPQGAAAFPGAIALSLAGLPAGATCTISPASIAAGSDRTTVTVTVTAAEKRSSTAAFYAPHNGFGLPGPLVLALLLPLAGKRRARRWFGPRSKLSVMILALVVLVATVGMTACSSGSSAFTYAPQTYSMTLTGTSGSLQHTATLNLAVR